MSTDVETTNQTRTPPASPQERALQGVATQAARLGLPQLQFNADYIGATLGLPFSDEPYRTLTREELGLPESKFWDQFDISRRARILDNPTHPEYRAAQAEAAEENAARQQYITQAQARYGQVQQTPLARLTQSQIEQELGLLPQRQLAETAQLGQNVAQSQLGRQYAQTVAPLQLEQTRQAAQAGLGLMPASVQAAGLGLNIANQFAGPAAAEAANYLTRAGTASDQALDAESRIRADVTDLVTSGRAASPAQQAIIDRIYNNRLAQVESDLQRQRDDAVRTLPDIATGRGLRLTSADMPDRWNLIGREYLRAANQAAMGLAAEAGAQSLNYPLQTAGLGLQQQYLTGQQTQRVPQAIGLQPGAGLSPALQTAIAFGQGAQSNFPGYLNQSNMMNQAQGTNAYNPFGMPFNLQGAVIGGSPFSVQAQSPLMQSRLSNMNTDGTSTTGGTLAALQGVGGLLSGIGSIAAGGAAAYKACWIAMALYGDDSWKVPLLRWFIGGPLSTTDAGKRFAEWYTQYGPSVAESLKRQPARQKPWRRAFDRLVEYALEFRARSVVVSV